MYVDVYRSTTAIESEFDITAEEELSLVYRDVPIHTTPYRPRDLKTIQRDGQTTRITANTRRNYILRKDDELRAKDGRKFVVETVDPTGGAFMDNSIILELSELDAAP